MHWTLGAPKGSLDPGVSRPVPQDVDEANERSAVSRHRPAQAVALDNAILLALADDPSTEGLPMKPLDRAALS
jgi:hypothetical protein